MLQALGHRRKKRHAEQNLRPHYRIWKNRTEEIEILILLYQVSSISCHRTLSAQDHSIVTSLGACPDKGLGVSPKTLCSGYLKHEKRKLKYCFFFPEQWSTENVQRLPFGRLPAVHNFLILPLPYNLFFPRTNLINA